MGRSGTGRKAAARTEAINVRSAVAERIDKLAHLTGESTRAGLIKRATDVLAFIAMHARSGGELVMQCRAGNLKLIVVSTEDPETVM